MSLDDFENKVNDLWQNHRWLLVVLAIPLVILKFRSVIINLLVKDSRQILDNTQKQDSALANQQSEANTKSNQIIADADKERKDSQDQPVDENWNKK